MVTAVPVEFVGESVGVKDFSGVLDIAKHELGVRCLPADLPGHIRVDVSALKIGDIIHIRDLEKISGVEFVDGEDVAVVACKSVVEESKESRAETESVSQTAEVSESKEKETK